MYNTNNILIVGSNSISAISLAKVYKKHGFRVYGLGRVKNFQGCEIYNENMLYVESFDKLFFDEVLVIASRTPSDGGDLVDFIEDNLNILYKAVYEAKGFSKIIFFSSFSVYDQSSSEIHLKTKYDARSSYGLSKLLCENYLKDNSNKYLILRIPVLLYPGVKNNFMAKLKNAIFSGNTFNFSNLDFKVNAFFSLNDYEKINNQFLNCTINCCTKPDWTIKQIVEYSLALGLSSYNIIEPSKPAQIIQHDNLPVSNTSKAIMDFLNEK